MIIELENTTATDVGAKLVQQRRNLGPSSGLVFTLIVICDARQLAKAQEAALKAARSHPSRVLVLVRSRAKSDALHATIRSGEDVPGDVVTLRVSGAVAEHAESVVLPLLLPDLPTVVWWPFVSPTEPSEDPIGALATRRITDAAGDSKPLAALVTRAQHHTPGGTDLVWTRLTPWRALLVAALDQTKAKVTSVSVEAARDNAPAALLAAWLATRLKCPVESKATRGPGITAVRFETADGEVALARQDGLVATYTVPGQPDRTVALRRRPLEELLTEELRRLDPDDVFDETLHELLKRVGSGTKKAQGTKAGSASRSGSASKSGAKRKQASKKPA